MHLAASSMIDSCELSLMDVERTNKRVRNTKPPTDFEILMAGQLNYKKKPSNNSLRISKMNVHHVQDEQPSSGGFKLDKELAPGQTKTNGAVDHYRAQVSDTQDNIRAQAAMNSKKQNFIDKSQTLESPSRLVLDLDKTYSSEFKGDSWDRTDAGKLGGQVVDGCYTFVSITNNEAVVSHLQAQKKMHTQKYVKVKATGIFNLSVRDQEDLKKYGVMLELPACQVNSGHAGIEEMQKCFSPVVSVSFRSGIGFEEGRDIGRSKSTPSSDTRGSSDAEEKEYTETENSSDSSVCLMDDTDGASDTVRSDESKIKDSDQHISLNKTTEQNHLNEHYSRKLRRKSKVDYSGTKVTKYYVESVNKNIKLEGAAIDTVKGSSEGFEKTSVDLLDKFKDRNNIRGKRTHISSRKRWQVKDCTDELISETTDGETDEAVSRQWKRRKIVDVSPSSLDSFSPSSEEMVSGENAGEFYRSSKNSPVEKEEKRNKLEETNQTELSNTDTDGETIPKPASDNNNTDNESSVDSLLLENPFEVIFSSPDYTKICHRKFTSFSDEGRSNHSNGSDYSPWKVLLNENTLIGRKNVKENTTVEFSPSDLDRDICLMTPPGSRHDHSKTDNESPLRTVKDKAQVSKKCDNLCNVVDSGKKMNGKCTGMSISAEMGKNQTTESYNGTGNHTEKSVEKSVTTLDKPAVKDLHVAQSELIKLLSGEPLQTTIDTFFPVLKTGRMTVEVTTHTTRKEQELMISKARHRSSIKKSITEIDQTDAAYRDPASGNVCKGEGSKTLGATSDCCNLVEPDSSVNGYCRSSEIREPEEVSNNENEVRLACLEKVNDDSVVSKTGQIDVLSGNDEHFVEPDSSVGEHASVIVTEDVKTTNKEVETECMEVSSGYVSVTSKADSGVNQSHDRGDILNEKRTNLHNDVNEQLKQNTGNESPVEGEHNSSQETPLIPRRATNTDNSYVEAPVCSSRLALSDLTPGREPVKVVCRICQREFKNGHALSTHIRYCRKWSDSKGDAQTTQTDASVSSSSSRQDGSKKISTTEKETSQQSLNGGFLAGDVVWGRFSRNSWWPAMVVTGTMVKRSTKNGCVWLYWLSDRQISQVNVTSVEPFKKSFISRCKQKAKPGMQLGIENALEICASRADVDLKEFGSLDAWTKSDRGFLSFSKHRFAPDPERPVPGYVLKDLNCTLESSKLADVSKNEDEQKRCFQGTSAEQIEPPTCSQNVSSGSQNHLDPGTDPIEPPGDSIDLDQADCGGIDETICIACKTDIKVACNHPLFRGNVCGKCKDNLRESFYAEDDDGCSMFCGICGDGGGLYVCADNDCGKAFCFNCVERHTSADTVKKIEGTKKWKCFLCTQYSRLTHGSLTPHEDWSLEVVRFFQANTASMCNELQYLKNSGRRKMRVLSLFDGVGSGKVALDELGLDVEVYYASEINPDAMLVANFHHRPVQLGDIWDLNSTRLQDLCPIDLVLAGPPCNDLSIVNPNRKGFNGTGLLVWRFVAVLKDIQSLCETSNHVFWLMENTGSMLTEYKQAITKQFEMEPVVWDAKHFTGQRRARNFWGNIPGMFSTPKFCKQLEKQKKDLNAALISNCNRIARISHTRTITSSSNSLTITNGVNNALVSMNGEPDHIWVQELERLFGFPIHYTDVGQLTQESRRKLLGKAWSVPVIKHILSPLRKYFKLKDN